MNQGCLVWPHRGQARSHSNWGEPKIYERPRILWERACPRWGQRRHPDFQAGSAILTAFNSASRAWASANRYNSIEPSQCSISAVHDSTQSPQLR